MAITKRLRFEILRRDNHTCRYCGENAPTVKLVIDHVVPEALGGETKPENLVTACEPCNSGKSSVAPGSSLVADVNNDQLRWARAMAAARAIRKEMREEQDAYSNYFLALWRDWKCEAGDIPLPDAWRTSIDRFFEADVDPDEIQRCVRIAMAATHVDVNKLFKYFCGCVWRSIRETQEIAADIVMTDLADEINGGF